MIDELVGLTDPWHIILELIILVAAIAWAWEKAVKPGWRAVQGFVNQRERQDKLNHFADSLHPEKWQILQDIADRFKPNGESLYDIVKRGEKERNNIQVQLDEINNKIDEFLVGRRNGGNRWNDPHD